MFGEHALKLCCHSEKALFQGTAYLTSEVGAAKAWFVANDHMFIWRKTCSYGGRDIAQW